MKKLLAVVVAGLLLSSIAFAQDVTPAQKAGAKSLNFTFGGLGAFGLRGTGPAAGIGASYFLSDNAAVRAGLQVAINSTSTPSNLTTGGTDGSTSQFLLGVSADYLMYMNAGRVRPYLGAGLNFATSSFDNKPVDKRGFDEQKGLDANGNPTGTIFGLGGIVGAEFFVYSEISLSAEYQLNLISIMSASDVQTTVGNTTTTAKGGSATNVLGFGAAGATLHIYF
ncbi:MAG: outer membrane beta-barrel protein [Bacteroidota bacterium]|nr:outer membrane beta-barrel protein [Bacteroidota bacterium]